MKINPWEENLLFQLGWQVRAFTVSQLAKAQGQSRLQMKRRIDRLAAKKLIRVTRLPVAEFRLKRPLVFWPSVGFERALRSAPYRLARRWRSLRWRQDRVICIAPRGIQLCGGLVGAVAGVVVGALTLAMAPSSKRVQTAKLDPSSKFSWTLAIAVAGCVVLCFSPALNLTGGLVYAGTGLALLAILARQLVCHQVGWHTANPQILASDRDPWRAGARKLNIALASGSNDMKNLAIEGLGGFAVVSAGLVLQPLCYLGCSWAGVKTWSWWVPLLTLATLLVFDRIWVRHSKSSETFAAAMGHWFDYQKNGESSPLVYQSPAGSAARRTFLVWHVVAVLTVGMATMISNIEFLDQLGAPMTRQDRAIVALMDTALAAITVPWLVWYGLKIITAPALVAAWALHEFPSTKNADPESKPKEQHHACTNDSRSL